MEPVTMDCREAFTSDMYLALVDQMGDNLAALSIAEYLIADRTLRHAVAVLFLESVAPASPMMH